MYEVTRQYAPLGIDLFQTKNPVTVSRAPLIRSITGLTPSSASSEGLLSTSNLMLVGAVAGAGLLAYVAARALKK